jgi:hypothetical protein
MLAATASAREPNRNVSGKLHPNLAAAQRLSQPVVEKVTAAQKAKELLEQVNNELELAAEAANRNK